MSVEGLQQSPMIHHLLDTLDWERTLATTYGRLAFAVVAHSFSERDELVEWPSKDGNLDEMRPARWPSRPRRGPTAPRRERILGWQEQKDFSICPNPDDPDACNVYSELQLPDEAYQDIQECQEKDNS